MAGAGVRGLISAAARTSLSRTPLDRLFGHGPGRDQLVGALAGAPLMLCSCCAAPIFPSIYRRTRKAGPALALTLAAPLLNPASLALIFILFPFRLAATRLALALGSGARRFGLGRQAEVGRVGATAEGATPRERRWPEVLWAYARSLLDVSLRTVPLILAGIWASK